MHNRKRFLVPLLVILVLGAIGVWYLTQERGASAGGPIEASGTVEAVEVFISAEQGGRVAEVLVAKGELVETNDALLYLEDEMLQSQRKRAVSAIETARASLISAQIGLVMAQATLNTAETNLEVINANAEAELLPAQQALDALYDNAEVARTEALQNVANANQAVRDAQYQLDNFTIPNNQRGLTAEEAIDVMRERLDQARENFEPYKYASSSDAVRKQLKDALEEAQSDYDSAVRRLRYETAFEQANAWLDKAQQDLDTLKDGPDPKDVAVLKARITAIKMAPKQAEAALEQAKVGVVQAQATFEQVEKMVEQVQAELELIDVQLDKLIVTAPTSGIVLSRNVEKGEVIQPGAPFLTVGQLDKLTVTVYVPEDRYGQIKLGEEARVRVDSFPGEVFTGTVVYIANKAEFTPRNVQTPEGRRTTVFAIEIAIDNPENKLKPGMPADVEFGR
jgi:multidrug resistance efflux pump